MPEQSAEQKKLLTNVVIIRPGLIFLLVFYHAFAIYGGAWQPITGYPQIEAYWWIDKLAYAFMLETFVFISGYVFGYQVRIKGAVKLAPKNLLGKKFKRLIIPSMVFSLLYILLLGDIHQPLSQTLYDIVDGTAHMWFLPMLFWCFVCIDCIEKLRLRPAIVIPLLAVCAVCSFIPLPLRLGNTMYYMLFFYIGYILQRQNVDTTHLYNVKTVAVLTIAFALLFVGFTLAGKAIGNGAGEPFIRKSGILALHNLMKMLCATAGLAMLFAAVGLSEAKRTTPLPAWMVSIGALCYGVYLLQQFILKGLYNYTSLPTLLNPYTLPWAGFVIALLSSVLLAWLMRQTRWGRFLIG